MREAFSPLIFILSYEKKIQLTKDKRIINTKKVYLENTSCKKEPQLMPPNASASYFIQIKNN
jgi:hypothetical protein